MKTKILCGLLLAATMGFTACKKKSQTEDAMKPPTMTFKTSAGYVSADASLPVNDTIKIGIDAHRAEENDNLTKFLVTQKYDAGTATTIVNESMNVVDYSKDVQIITRNVAGTEAYTFTITNRDGISNSQTITLTVHP